MTALAELTGLAGQMLWLYAIVFLRVGPVMSLFPGFGDQGVPVRVRLALAAMLTAVTAPAIAAGPGGALAGLPPPYWLLATETGIGLLLGIGLRLFLIALQTAGAMAAQAMSLSQIVGSAGAEPMPAMGHFLAMGGLALAFALGLHVRAAQMMILSYDLFPLGQAPAAAAVAGWGVARVAHAFGLAFTLAAPFVIVSVLYNLTLGIVNRAMPQLMVVFVGAPVITGAGLALLMLLAPMMLTLWMEALSAFVANPLADG